MLNLQITYWTIGGFAGEKPVVQAIADARALGYDGLELAFGAGELTPATTREQCQQILDDAAKVGVKIETMACGNHWGLPLTNQDEAKRREAVEFTRAYIRVAGWLKVKTILLIPGAVDVGWDPSVPVTPYQKAWDTATKSLKELLPDAERAGVNIGLENVWNKFLTGPIEMKTFIDQFGSERIGSYFDVGNVVITGYPEHWIEILGPRIKAVHVKNFKREDAGGVLHGFGDDLLQGDVNWDAVKRALTAINYQGPITAEMLPFCRLPDMVLPDMELAKDTAGKLRGIFGA